MKTLEKNSAIRTIGLNYHDKNTANIESLFSTNIFTLFSLLSMCFNSSGFEPIKSASRALRPLLQFSDAGLVFGSLFFVGFRKLLSLIALFLIMSLSSNIAWAQSVTCPQGDSSNGSGYAAAQTNGAALINEIFWLDWTCGATVSFQPGDDITKTFDIGNGVIITAVIDNITHAIEPFSSDDFNYIVLNDYYTGVSHNGLRNFVDGEDPQFRISYSAVINGLSIPFEYIIADAESTGFNGGTGIAEQIAFTTTGGAFDEIERNGNPTVNGIGTTSASFDHPHRGGSSILSSTGVNPVFEFSVMAGGRQAPAFGVRTTPPPPVPFTCQANLYQSHGANGQLSVIDIFNSSLNDLPNSAGYQINAIGYRAVDDLIYGIRSGSSRQLIRIDATGTVTELGEVLGLTSDTNAGDFAGDGYLHVREPVSPTIHRIDVTTGTIVSSYNPAPAVPHLPDLTYNPVTGLLYGIPDGTNNDLYSINPITGVSANLGSTGIVAASTFGAAFSDASGAMYFSRNTDGAVFQVTVPSPTAVLVGQSASATANDGAFCHAATFSPSLNLSKSADTSTLSSPLAVGDTITYTFEVENTGNVALDLGATPISDTMNLGPNGSGALVSLSTGPTFVPASDINNNGHLDVGEIFQYTATFDLTMASIDAGGVHNTATTTGNPVTASGADIAGLADVTDLSDNDATGDGIDGVDTSTGGTGDTTGDDNPTVVDLGVPFTCQANLYQVYSLQGRLAVIDLANGTLNNRPNFAGFPLNAAGYNVADNYIYAINPAGLFRIDATGAVTSLGAVPGLTGKNLGDFAGDGLLHVKSNNSSTIDRVNVSTGTIASSYTVSTNFPMVDFTYNPLTGLLYGISPGGTNDLISIDPDTGTTVNLGTTGLTSTGGFGAAFGDASGSMFFSRNDDGAVFQINLPSTMATLVGISQPSENNDGAFCHDATFLSPDALELTKSANTAALSSPLAVGDTITYTFNVENRGNLAFDLGATPISDTMNLGADGTGASVSLTTGPTLVVASDLNSNGRLDVGETFQYTATFNLTQAAIDAGGVHNTASSTGNPVDASGNDIPGVADVTDISDNDATGDGIDGVDNSVGGTGDTTGEDNPTVVALPAPSLDLTKSADTSALSSPLAVGDTITYTFDVENTGNLALDLGATPISDTMNLGADGTGASVSLTTGPTLVVASDPNSNGRLDVGETFQYTATFNLTQAAIDAGGVHNTASSTGNPVDASGNDILGVADVTDISDNDATGDGIDGVDNSVGGTGDTTGDDNPTVVALPAPSLDLTKSADTSALSSPLAVGDTITYTFDVENTGNLALDLGATPISDTMNLGADGTGASVSLTTGPTLVVASDPNSNGRLDVGETFQYTATFDLTQAAIDAGGVHNTASSTGNPVDASGNDILGVADVTDISDNDATGDGIDGVDNSVGGTGDTTGDDNPTVVALPAPSLDLTKSADTSALSSPLAVGDTITYTFDVENTGNLALDPGATPISDTMNLGADGTGASVSLTTGPTLVVASDPNSNGRLDADETFQYTATFDLTQAAIDAGGVHNTASSTGNPVDASGNDILGVADVTDISDNDATGDGIDGVDNSVGGTGDTTGGDNPTVVTLIVLQLEDIPTLSQWAIILLSLLLMGVGVLKLRRFN